MIAEHERAIVLVSGGMDSLVTAAVANRDCREINLLHISYGQRTQERELESFNALCGHLRPRRSMVLDWPWLAEIGGSALTDLSLIVPEEEPKDHIPATYVPFRNGIFLGAAVAWAEVIGAGAIYIGAVEEDSSGYPDCRSVFFSAYQSAVATGTRNEFPISIVTPVLHLSKAEIVRLGRELKVPFELSWSCYVHNEIACGVCASCRLRLRAFAEAGLSDPIRYRY